MRSAELRAQQIAERLEVIGAALRSAGIERRPLTVLDLDAFDANAVDLARRARGVPLRVASKSLRVRRLIDRAVAADGFRGVLAFTLPEALWLVEHGHDDVVVAYPSVDRAALRRLAADDAARAAITVMVDETAHAELILDACRGLIDRDRPIRVALELDAAFAPVPGVRFGALRSPVRTAPQLVELAREILGRQGLRLVGVMAYEGQIAGVVDDAGTPRGAAVRTMKRLSVREIAARRAEAVAAVQELAELEFVNGGGTGSVETTGAESAVTEIAAGSGLIGAGLFDHYRGFSPTPALFTAFPVVRRPGPDVATLLGGGRIASSVPGADRLPTIDAPEGLSFAPQEGAGEVQTPVVGPAAESLRLGDDVWLRHAKAGEPAEHTERCVLVAGVEARVVDEAPTYRGEQRCFL